MTLHVLLLVWAAGVPPHAWLILNVARTKDDAISEYLRVVRAAPDYQQPVLALLGVLAVTLAGALWPAAVFFFLKGFAWHVWWVARLALIRRRRRAIIVGFVVAAHRAHLRRKYQQKAKP